MWRFILVTFAFLGWAFYELSGGADYTPGPNSLQTARAEKRADAADRARRLALAPKADTRPEARPATLNGAAVVLASANSGDTTGNDDKRVRLTLSTRADATGRGVATVTVDPAKIIALTQPATPRPPVQIEPGVENPALAALQAALSAAPEDSADGAAANSTAAGSQDDGDIRAVEAARVNLRGGPSTEYEVITQLTRGTRVEVIHDDGAGWVELQVMDSGETGWMADYLLGAAN